MGNNLIHVLPITFLHIIVRITILTAITMITLT
jgi:hypothetical protein